MPEDFSSGGVLVEEKPDFSSGGTLVADKPQADAPKRTPAASSLDPVGDFGALLPSLEPQRIPGAERLQGIDTGPQLRAPKQTGRTRLEDIQSGAGQIIQEEPLQKLKREFGRENLTDEEFIDQNPELNARYGLMMNDPRLRAPSWSGEQVSKATGLGPKTAGVVAGGENFAAGIYNFLTSPAGVATLATGGVAGAAGTSGNVGIQAALKALTTRGFAADMASKYPETTLQVMDSLSKKDTQGATAGILNAALAMGVISGAVHSKLTPAVPLDARIEVPTGETPQGPLANGRVLETLKGALPPEKGPNAEVGAIPSEARQNLETAEPTGSAGVAQDVQATIPTPETLAGKSENAPSGLGEVLSPTTSKEAGMEKNAGEGPAAEASAIPAVDSYAAKSKVIADKIRSAFKTETQGQLFTGPVQLINAAVEVAAKIIEGGGKVADAIDAAVKHLRANYKGTDYKGEVDEDAFATKLRAVAGEDQPPKTPPAQPNRDAKGVYGVAERVRDERAKAGQVDPVPPGRGISAPDSVDIGRALKSQGADPEAIMTAFEDTKKLSSDDMAVARAHGEDLARAAKTIEDKSGTNNPEYRAAYKALSDWDRRSKFMQTEWHKTGMAQQGETDIDTGTFTGLQRAFKDASDRDLTPDQAQTAKQRAKKVREAFGESEKAKQKWLKNVADWESRSNPEKRAFDAANKTVRDAASRLAEAERKSGEIDAKRDADVAKIQNTAAEKAGAAAEKTLREAAVRLADAENKSRVAKTVQEKQAAKVQEEAARRAFAAANKTVTSNADRLARNEIADRVKAAAREKAAAEVQVKAAKAALEAANKRMREASVRAAKEQAKNEALKADPSARVWKQAGVYIEKGEDNPDEIRNKVATDLGMSIDEVNRALAKDKKTKFLSDDLWRKQQVARRLDQSAKRWVTQAAIPTYLRAIQNVPRILFSLKVGFHGTVALGTHAPMVAFQPMFWATYVRDFGKMYRMVGNRAYYEQQVQDLMRRPNYTQARRAGLVNDPFQFEDYNSPDTAKYFGGLTGMGNRGYTVLKILRQDMFDQHWNQLPKTAQVAEVAQAIADGVNHATGVVKVAAPKGAHVALFAPRLEASRVAWLAVDPAKAIGTFLNWKNAAEGDRHFAVQQLKEKAWVAGTMFGLLALNQGFLSATGSKQKINGLPQALGGAGFNPMESDFLKFKAAGMDASYGNAMLSMARLPARLATAIMYEGKMSKIVLEDERVAKIIWDYVRSQMSPFAGTATDLAVGRDFSERPLPRAGFGLLPGRKDIPKRLRVHGVTAPYSWPEYASEQFSPIPISEGIKEVWGNGGLGMTEKQMDATMKAWGATMIMMGTGGRISEDWQLKK